MNTQTLNPIAALLAAGIAATFGMPTGSAASSERAIHVEVTVDAPVAAVYDAWSTSTGAQTFFATKTRIEPRVGGPYEIYFNPADERMTTKGCKVLSYSPGEMISFQWRLPRDEFPDLQDAPMWVVVQMRAAGANRTVVTITHLGFGTGPGWDRAYSHMERGWSELAGRLKKRFEQGPVDWSTQTMMWQDRGAK